MGIQFSSLGANFLLTSLWGYKVFIQREFVALSLLWCFATSIMGVLILLFLRGLVVLAFRATMTTTNSILSNVADSSRKNNMAKEETQNFIDKLIVTIECSFAISSLVGVCLSWTMTDIILDMKGHIFHSVITLIVALIWCKFVMKCCSKNHQENANKDLLMTETEQQDYFHYHCLPSNSNCSSATVDAVIA